MNFHVFSILPLVPVAGGKLKDFAFRSEEVGHIRPAQPRRRLNERLEHSLQVEGRTAYDLEHVGGGRLLLQRMPRSSLRSRVFSTAMTA